MNIKVFASELHELLFGHAEVIRIIAVILIYLNFCMFADNVTESQHKVFLVLFALQQVYAAWLRVFLQEVRCQLLVFLFHFLKRRPHYFFGIVGIAEKPDGRIDIAFQITEAYNLAETLFLIQYTVGTAERLQQSVVLQVLVHIERIELLAVEARKEHAHDKAKVKRLHVRFLLFHALIDVIVIGSEILSSICRAEHFVVVIHDGLQFVRLTYAFADILSRTHSCLFVILATVGSVCEHSSDTDFRFQRLEYLVVTYEHWYGLHGKQRVKLSVKG